MAETTCYLVIEPRFGKKDWDREKLYDISVARATKTSPKQFKGIVVKLRLKIPDAAFKPLSPEVTIDVPEDALTYEPEIAVEFPEEE